LTSSLYRMSRVTVPMIGFISGATRERTGLFSQVLSKQFSVVDVNTTTVKSYVLDGLIYKDDRKTELTSDDITTLDTFVKNGKTLLVLADGVWVDDSLAVTASKSNINALLKKYTIELNKDLVVSNNSETASFRSGFMNYVVKYPYWIKAAVKDMPLIMPWSSSIKQNNTKDTSVLMSAPQGSGFVSGVQNVLPTNNVQLPRDQFTSPVLAVESTGNAGKLVVIGNSRLIEDDFNSRSISNIDFISKLMDGYLSKGILSNIKYRDTGFIQLPETTDSVKQTVRYVNIIAPGLLFALFGFYLSTQRKKV
ncbi:MAG: Gldg family protein, partial [Patescibacteria group bacterium]